jgi:hypothetical protein
MSALNNLGKNILFRGAKKIALIGPDFFNYTQSIRDEILKREYNCTYFDERHSNSLITKIAYRLQINFLVKKMRDQHFNKIYENIVKNSFTEVFLIDTEVVTAEFVIRLQACNIKVYLYMWDSSRNKDSFISLLPLVDGKASFDPEDCDHYKMRYIPLFAENVFSSASSKGGTRENRFVFLGTLHSHRAQKLLYLENLLKKSGFEIYKLLYYHSRVLYLIKCIACPRALKYLSTIRTRGFSKTEIAKNYLTSKGVLDIHHPGQSGLTSRTFETLRSGAWLITLNQTAKSLPLELRHRIIILSNLDALQFEVKNLATNLPPLSPSMDYFLSLERFVDQLLDLGDVVRCKNDNNFSTLKGQSNNQENA